jgi:hypothetical protein
MAGPSRHARVQGAEPADQVACRARTWKVKDEPHVQRETSLDGGKVHRGGRG